jgi:hypothetical protein
MIVLLHHNGLMLVHLLVHKDHKDHKASLDHKDHKASLDHKDRKVLKVLLVHKVLKVHKDHKVFKVFQVVVSMFLVQSSALQIFQAQLTMRMLMLLLTMVTCMFTMMI